jgi:arylsulfatase A-like enzyme
LNGAIDYYTHERDGGLDWNRNGTSVREEGYSTFLLGAETVKRIKGRDKSRPFFHYLAFNSPHAPLQAPEEIIDRYANIKDEKRRRFCAMTDAMDQTIGKVLAALDEEGIAGNTLVLFFSDNGGPVGSGATNTPLRAGKATTFEGGIRVPAVMRWPGKIKAGAVSHQMMTMMDYFPTLIAAAGIEPGNHRPFDGRNLWPALVAGREEPREDLFFSVEAGGAPRYAVHHQEWKLVIDGEKKLLFRIVEDPNETTDLAAKEPKLVADLAARIDQWKQLHPKNGERNTNRAPAGFHSPPLWAEAAREG